MIDYPAIITALSREIDECNHRYRSGYTTVVPAYYQQEIRSAIAALLKCQESLEGLQHPQEDCPHDPYKTDQLLKMLEHETSSTETHYGANLKHWHKGTKPLTIDAGGIRALISYYAKHRTDLGNNE